MFSKLSLTSKSKTNGKSDSKVLIGGRETSTF